MAAALPPIRPAMSALPADLNDVCIQVQESCQHECFAHKLREAEIEERYGKAAFSQAQLDEAMEDIFATWGA